MKPLILLLTAFSAMIFNANAQISGTAKDANGTPVNGATVKLLKGTDTTTVKLAVTKENGSFVLSNVPAGNYKLFVSHVTLKPFVSPAFDFNGSSLQLPELRLPKAEANLGGVTVTSKKPIVEVKADKTIVNVEGTINATGNDALELLRKSPGVMVDKDDNISLSGKNGVQVFIDGRPSPLSGQDLAHYLKSLQSTQIESIELITNPSAKYEAAGNAGIINIKLKKNKSF